ncbi:MAG: 50S ribosomal protein L21 [Armatimonadota bacterium]|nr:50S ribosomal protein L21 [Armatimonadota bacterium]MDR7422930.1 50S ribosomal protein L21 [Armatimonadota bacterium]MDR7454688.1 50S ribosomal protein L21 [Armatimonadota bacterium]MDR7456323.1 50S ribosomal protein L21 [Armatimonadota bacterium]MDR7496320.1 50S ribosomal protein L21 [Armatimonadota bacterium]
MYAVIETGGKQLAVREGDVVRVEKLEAAPGDVVTLDRVLLVGNGRPRMGAPTVDGATVQARVVRTGRGRKIAVMKFKAKAHSRRKTGHRQAFTELRIERITVPAG